MILRKEVIYLIAFTSALKVPTFGLDKPDSSLWRERMADSD
jgi:hypothetical protein